MGVFTGEFARSYRHLVPVCVLVPVITGVFLVVASWWTGAFQYTFLAQAIIALLAAFLAALGSGSLNQTSHEKAAYHYSQTAGLYAGIVSVGILPFLLSSFMQASVHAVASGLNLILFGAAMIAAFVFSILAAIAAGKNSAGLGRASIRRATLHYGVALAGLCAFVSCLEFVQEPEKPDILKEICLGLLALVALALIVVVSSGAFWRMRLAQLGRDTASTSTDETGDYLPERVAAALEHRFQWLWDNFLRYVYWAMGIAIALVLIPATFAAGIVLIVHAYARSFCQGGPCATLNGRSMPARLDEVIFEAGALPMVDFTVSTGLLLTFAVCAVLIAAAIVLAVCEAPRRALLSVAIAIVVAIIGVFLFYIPSDPPVCPFMKVRNLQQTDPAAENYCICAETMVPDGRGDCGCPAGSIFDLAAKQCTAEPERLRFERVLNGLMREPGAISWQYAQDRCMVDSRDEAALSPAEKRSRENQCVAMSVGLKDVIVPKEMCLFERIAVVGSSSSDGPLSRNVERARQRASLLGAHIAASCRRYALSGARNSLGNDIYLVSLGQKQGAPDTTDDRAPRVYRGRATGPWTDKDSLVAAALRQDVEALDFKETCWRRYTGSDALWYDFNSPSGMEPCPSFDAYESETPAR